MTDDGTTGATSYDDQCARWSYEQLIVRQPHLNFGGLWRRAYVHFAVCPGYAAAQAADGNSLRVWFDSMKPMGAPLQLVEGPPEGAELVPERSAVERVWLAGYPRGNRDLLVDLTLALPPEFPHFEMDYPEGRWVFCTKEELSPEQKNQVVLAFARLGEHTRTEFHVDPLHDLNQKAFRFKHGQGDIQLMPSKLLPTTYGRDLRFLAEEDEGAWTEKKATLLAGTATDAAALLPESWRSRDILSCLVDATAFPVSNLRNYLSLYDTVILAPPLGGKFEAGCSSMGVTPEELREVIRLGRVRLVLPQSLDRYDSKWLSEVAEACPSQVLLSRRLAMATIAEARRRVPLLHAPISSAGRHELLNHFFNNAEEIVGTARSSWFKAFVCDLGHAWAVSDWFVHAEGAMGTSQHGIGLLASHLYQEVTGHDLRIEIWAAAKKVEWAAALGAHVFPDSLAEYHDTGACDFVASLYNPSKASGDVVPQTSLSTVAQLLGVDNRVGIVDFAKEFKSASIQRLRQLVLRMIRENVDPDYLADAISAFNADVRRYEKNPDELTRLNLVGLTAAGATALGVVPQAVVTAVPLAGLMLGYMLVRALRSIPDRYVRLGAMVDLANAALAGTLNADAVLVSRVRKDVARLRNA